MRKVAGTRSNLKLLFSSLWTVVMLLLLIGGHLLIVLTAYSWLTGGDFIETATGILPAIPAWSLWAGMAAALALDVWIAGSARRERQKKIRRD